MFIDALTHQCSKPREPAKRLVTEIRPVRYRIHLEDEIREVLGAEIVKEVLVRELPAVPIVVKVHPLKVVEDVPWVRWEEDDDE